MSLRPSPYFFLFGFLLLLVFIAVGGAWLIEWWGYAPCELCSKQRLAYYLALPIAVSLIFFFYRFPGTPLLPGLFLLLSFLFFFNTGLAFYHVGVEEKWWEGPDSCTSPQALPESNAVFLEAIQKTRITPCHIVQLKVFGLSLSSWNILNSLTLCLLSVYGCLRLRRDQDAVYTLISRVA